MLYNIPRNSDEGGEREAMKEHNKKGGENIMAVETTIKSVRCNMKLNNGLDPEGNVQTVSVSLGTLNKNTWDAQKALNITALAAPCLAKTLYSTEKTETDYISERE